MWVNWELYDMDARIRRRIQMAETFTNVITKVLGRDDSEASDTNARFKEFDRLVKQHQKQAYNIAYRMTGNHADAEDLTQEAFVRAYRFFGRYRRDWPFDNWLYKIMTNLFVDNLRRKPKAKLQSLDQPLDFGNKSDDIFVEVPDVSSNPERLMLSKELDGHIQQALNSLPPDFRMTVILSDIEGLSYEEVSEAMKCSLGTVRSRLHRGRKQLRNKIIAFEKEHESDDLLHRTVPSTSAQSGMRSTGPSAAQGFSD
jgi:RNA polymerase sigma-70 factor, ECF subfamily